MVKARRSSETTKAGASTPKPSSLRADPGRRGAARPGREQGEGAPVGRRGEAGQEGAERLGGARGRRRGSPPARAAPAPPASAPSTPRRPAA